jgi:hypothetical protein
MQISNFGRWLLFVICYLVLEIYLTHTRQIAAHFSSYYDKPKLSTSEFMASKFSLGVTGDVVPEVEKM